MQNKYVKYLYSTNKELGMIVKSFLSNGNIDELQEFIKNTLNVSIVVDGVLGPQTIIYLSELIKLVTISDIITNVKKLENDKLTSVKPKHLDSFKHKKTVRQILMGHLASVEGTRLHYNKGEKSWTSPYGVYKYAWKNTEVVAYIDSLYKKYNLSPRYRANAYKMNTLITESERKRISNLAWEFYQHEFLDDRITTILKTKQDSLVSWFSISVNGGVTRGVKALQYASNATIDGVLGKNTLTKLIKLVSTKGDDFINQKELRYMHKFYHSLVTGKRGDYFKRFTTGWMNRLKSLKYITIRNNCNKL